MCDIHQFCCLWDWFVVCAVLEGGCAFVVPCERSAALSQDEEVIIVCGDAKLWSVSVASCCCLAVLGGFVKEVIKALAALLDAELPVCSCHCVGGRQH